MDELELAAAAVTGAVGTAAESRGYGIYETDREGDRIVLRSATCAMWELAKSRAADGLPEDAFCGPHQAFYQELAASISPRLTFRYDRVLARGHHCCEWVFELLG